MERDVTNTAKGNPKMFWQYINRTTPITTGIKYLETLSNKLTGNDKEEADILANFFSSVFTKEDMDGQYASSSYKENMRISWKLSAGSWRS